MVHLDAADVFAQWAAGLFVWSLASGGRRPLAFGFAWVVRTVVAVLVALSLGAAALIGWVPVRDVATGLLGLFALVSLGWALADPARVRHEGDTEVISWARSATAARVIDGLAAVAGIVAVLAGAVHAGGPVGLTISRFVIGAAFFGGLSASVIFGHRILAHRELDRGPLHRSVTGVLIVWVLEVGVFLVPTGMVSVFTGEIDDGYNGILGWMWVACALACGALAGLARLALRDEEPSVVSSATSMMYLAAMMGFGADLIARALLAG